MSAGDLGVLRQEAGQEGPRMPAWKRELLERRKAKGGGCAAAEAVTSRLNGEHSASGREEAAGGSSGNSGRTHTVTPAAKRAASRTSSSDMSPLKTKEPWAELHRDDRAALAEQAATNNGESLVLQESLGPLNENPFIKLEKERKKRREREIASRPLHHILEMYSAVPGVRTIRAENIIIIESDPQYFTEAGSGSQLNGGTGNAYSSLSDLLERTGSPVTEIRAKEVVIYDTALSKSEENLSTLGRCELPDQGTVSRMRQKFDRTYGKLHVKSHSSENLLDLDTSSVRSAHRARGHYSDLVPKYAPGSPVHQPPYSQSIFQTSEIKQSPSDSQISSPVSRSPQLAPSGRRHFDAAGVGSESESVSSREDPERCQAKTLRERHCDTPDAVSSTKVPCTPKSHCSRAETSSTPPQSGFEIRPSPRPELASIPAGDTQACALANLRLQSRNSFTVIPKRHGSPSPPVSTTPSPSYPRVESPASLVPNPAVPLVAFSSPEKLDVAPGPTVPIIVEPRPAEKLSSPTSSHNLATSKPDSITESASPSMQEPTSVKLPVTFIDDIVAETSPPFPSPMMQRKKGNTFTVVPKRRTEAQSDTSTVQEPDPVPQGSPSSAQAPHAQLGTQIKKRYPAAEEIEVIGGYLSLGRSCLSKNGSTGKKLKISFNESSLHSTFEYPSESSFWDSGDEDEEGGGAEEETGEEEEEGVISEKRMRIPRPSYTSSPTNHIQNSSDLSSYSSKQSVEFAEWQEQNLDDSTHPSYAKSQRANTSEDVMLTPADSSSLSDFSSEPALYF